MTKIGRRQPDGAGAGTASRLAGRIARIVCAAAPAALLSTFLLAPPAARSQGDDDTSEYPVKLAFLYNFTKFVEWPTEAFPNPAAPLNICLVGRDPFEPDIEQDLRGRTVRGHPVALLKFKPGENLKGCHVVFVSRDSGRQAMSIVGSLRGWNTLTVGESKDFAANGGMITLIVEENKLRFEVNLDATKQTHLSISSQLLALARMVKGSPRRE